MPSDCKGLSTEEYIQICMYIPEKINKCVNLLAESYLKGTNLKTYYVPYILHIKRKDGISQKELKSLIPFDKSRISVVVHELIDKGLIYNDGTGRNSSLHLTDAGINTYPLCKMFFDIVKKEIFCISLEDEALMRAKYFEFNTYLDQLILKLEKN